MDLRKAYLRRSMRQARLHKRLAVAAVLAASAGAVVLLQADEKEVDQEALAAVLARPAAPGVVRMADQPMPARARRVYPYSIVPGGLRGRAELVHAVMADKVVAAHYAGFDVHKASLRSVGKPRAVYVSYRKGGQVYWTSKKVMLAEGETLLSDGEHDIRARCGNRIAETPQLPVEVKGPSEQELDTPVEQAGDGEVRQVAYDPEDDAGTAQAFVLGAFPNGAGLLSASQTGSGASQTGAFKTPDWNSFGGSYAGSAAPVSALGVRTINTTGGINGGASSGTNGGTNGGASSGAGAAPGDTGGESASTGDNGSGGSGGIAYGGDSGGSHAGGDPGFPLAPASNVGGDVGDIGGVAAGGAGSAIIADASKPPMESLRPDGLPTVPAPSKENAVPEPGSLWLAGLAAAGLLLRRRRS